MKIDSHCTITELVEWLTVIESMHGDIVVVNEDGEPLKIRVDDGEDAYGPTKVVVVR
jgi:hypothetical protein